MTSRFERMSAIVTAVLAVVLWIAGLAVGSLADNLADKASDEETLAWFHGNANTILTGGWLWVVGCLAFLWFAGILRAHLAAAEGGLGTGAAIGFGGAVATAVFGAAVPLGDVAASIEEKNISAATAGALHHLIDMFFVGAELSLVVLLAAVAVLSLRAAAFPRWWGYVSILVGVVLLIGPIGWAALIFGTPVWTLVTAWLLAGRRAAAAAPAV